MSLILDALRKSEQERRQTDAPVLAPPVDTMAKPRRYPSPFAVFAVLVLLSLAAGGYWISQRGSEATIIGSAGPAPPSMEDSKVALAVAPATDGKAEAVPGVPRAPQLTVNPFVSKREAPAVRDLAREARVPRAEPEPVPPTVPEPVAVAATPAKPAPVDAVTGTAKFLRAMPPEFQRALPQLVVNIHIYAPRASDRILYINNRQYHAGDKVRDDIVVEEIVEDGAVLSFRGERFKLPRPS